MAEPTKKYAWITVIVAALGYFVDVYDLVLFSVVRIPSLQALGLSPDEVRYQGLWLMNIQMAGMLLGGFFWGFLGDRIGRCSVLFGSIACYSFANVANGFVSSVPEYAFWRFIAGIGLAGELGAGTTLAVELLPVAIRGYGTTLIASVGVVGAILASLVSGLVDWRTSYFIGGALGFALLAARVGTHESALLKDVEISDRRLSKVISLLIRPERLRLLASCVLVGIPIWFSVGLLITFATELGEEIFGGSPSVRTAVLFGYIGFFLGDITSGLLSQLIGSRKKVLATFMTLGMVSTIGYFFFSSTDTHLFYWTLAVGFSMGYWAVLITTSAEQFGTNVRATVATSVPNLVRGAIIPLSLLVETIRPMFGHQPLLRSTLLVGVLCYGAAFLSLRSIKETFGRPLDFIEEDK